MFRLVLSNLYETCSNNWVLINKCVIYICWSVFIRNVMEYMMYCFHIQGTRIKKTVFQDMTPYALVHSTRILETRVTLVFPLCPEGSRLFLYVMLCS